MLRRVFGIIAYLAITSHVVISGHAFAAQPIESESQVGYEIGKVQLMLGQQATLIRKGQTQPLTADFSLQEGDILKTGDATHIHLKMNDGAYVALRPASELKIECYQSNPEKPLCMKFDLKKGNMRAVSGKGSHADPQKYRLNTPVAAIGVRGTDFVTQIQNGATLVRVLEGAITVTPYSEGCQAGTLGNCSTEFTGLLTQDDTFMLKAKAGVHPEQIAISTDIVSRGETLKQQAGQQVAQQATKFGDVVQILKDDPELVKKYLELAGYNNTQDFEPQDKPDLAISQAPLMYGTWNEHNSGIARPFDEASEGRSVTVGNEAIGLWRANGVYQPPSGTLDYNLTESNAYIVTPGASIMDAQITSGTLSINFDKNQLKTQINIQPEEGRAINFNSAHELNRYDGIFALGGDDGRLAAGAISNDGQQVGYMINAPVEQGRLNAQTLWQAQ